MANLTLNELSDIMRHIDICMMTTTAAEHLVSRPMSNNRDVEYEGTSYFFTDETSGVTHEITAEPQVNLSYIGKHHVYVSVSGTASLIQNKQQMQKHWVKDLDTWFEQGIDTPGLTMIEVKADTIRYWKEMKEGILKI